MTTRPRSAAADDASGTRRDRAVSTVVDVSLALLFISAAMMLLAFYLQGGAAGHDPLTADQTAETLSGTTISVQYEIDEVASELHDESRVENDDAYERSRHGSVDALAAEAAVANTTLWGDRTSVTGDAYAAAIAGALQEQLTAADETNVRVTAVWRPWQNADVEGVARAGNRPPAGADVSSVTVAAPSGISINESRLRDDHGDDRKTARLIGNATVEHHFPPQATQRALESQGERRQLAIYHYRQWVRALDDIPNSELNGGDFDPDEEGSYLHRESANASAANDRLAEAFAAQAESEVAGSYSGYDEAREWVRAEQVQVTVQTWTE